MVESLLKFDPKSPKHLWAQAQIEIRHRRCAGGGRGAQQGHAAELDSFGAMLQLDFKAHTTVCGVRSRTCSEGVG